MQQNKRLLNKESLFDLLFAIGLGLTFMQLVVGLDKINPGFTSWILIRGSDISYHYLSWEYFKDGPWAWPPGRLEGYAYPMYNSVMYTDSIPLLALFFKAIRFILPNDFQYFGLWYALCFILNSYFGIRILKGIGWDKVMRWLLAPFFTGAVVLLARFGHAALCGQWLILYCLLIYLHRNLWTYKKVKLHTYTVVLLASLIHPYLLFMVLGLTTSIPMQLKIEYKSSWIKVWKEILIYLFISLGGWYISGAFLFKGQLSEGLGRFSANFNTFINAWDVGRWGPSFKYYGDGQGEGIAYLGLGILFILSFVLLIKIRERYTYNAKVKMEDKVGSKSVNVFFIVGLLFFVFALSPKWTLGNHLLMDWGYNDYISRTFRGTGRFAWPLFYFILYYVFYLFYNWQGPTRLKYFITIAIILLQAIDLSPLWKRKPYVDDPAFKMAYIDQIYYLMSQSEKVILYPPYAATTADFGDYIYFTDLSQRARKPITTGYGARFPESIGKVFRDSLNDMVSYLRMHPNDLLITHVDSLALHQKLIKEVHGVSFEFDRYRLFISDTLNSKIDLKDINPESRSGINHQKQIDLKNYLQAHQDHIILGCVYEEGVSNIKTTTKDYLKSTDLTMDSIQFGMSWAFILNRGKMMKESFFLNQVAEIVDSINCKNSSIPIQIKSGGYQTSKIASIQINRQEMISIPKRGLSLVVMDSCGQVLEKVRYDTYLSDGYLNY